MAGTSTATPPDLPGLMGASDSMRRNLYDSCRVVRVLSEMPECGLRRRAIESERDRAASLAGRYRESVERVIEAMTDGVRDRTIP